MLKPAGTGGGGSGIGRQRRFVEAGDRAADRDEVAGRQGLDDGHVVARVVLHEVAAAVHAEGAGVTRRGVELEAGHHHLEPVVAIVSSLPMMSRASTPESSCASGRT